MVHMLCIPPDLLDEIQFTMELWQKQNLNVLCIVGCLKDRFDMLEVGLVIEESVAAASNFTGWTIEPFAFSLQLGFGLKSSLLKNLSHSFEPACLLMSIRKIEWLWLSIGIASRFHKNLCLLWLAIRITYNSTIIILDRDSDSP